MKRPSKGLFTSFLSLALFLTLTTGLIPLAVYQCAQMCAIFGPMRLIHLMGQVFILSLILGLIIPSSMLFAAWVQVSFFLLPPLFFAIYVRYKRWNTMISWLLLSLPAFFTLAFILLTPQFPSLDLFIQYINNKLPMGDGMMAMGHLNGNALFRSFFSYVTLNIPQRMVWLFFGTGAPVAWMGVFTTIISGVCLENGFLNVHKIRAVIDHLRPQIKENGEEKAGPFARRFATLDSGNPLELTQKFWVPWDREKNELKVTDHVFVKESNRTLWPLWHGHSLLFSYTLKNVQFKMKPQYTNSMGLFQKTLPLWPFTLCLVFLVLLSFYFQNVQAIIDWVGQDQSVGFFENLIPKTWIVPAFIGLLCVCLANLFILCCQGCVALLKHFNPLLVLGIMVCFFVFQTPFFQYPYFTVAILGALAVWDITYLYDSKTDTDNSDPSTE